MGLVASLEGVQKTSSAMVMRIDNTFCSSSIDSTGIPKFFGKSRFDNTIQLWRLHIGKTSYSLVIIGGEKEDERENKSV